MLAMILGGLSITKLSAGPARPGVEPTLQAS
jgi:hypothetical protein